MTKHAKPEITMLSFDDYIQYLQLVNGYTKEEAIQITTKQYKKQWGKTPEKHLKEIEDIWNKSATGSRKINQ